MRERGELANAPRHVPRGHAKPNGTVFAGQGHRNTSSRRKECHFRCNAKLRNKYENGNGVGGLEFTLVTLEHNHPPPGQSAHPVHRKAAMTEEVRRRLERSSLRIARRRLRLRAFALTATPEIQSLSLSISGMHIKN